MRVSHRRGAIRDDLIAVPATAAGRMRFPARKRAGTLLLSFAAASALAAVPVAASASPSWSHSPVVGHVYLNDNTTGTNTIGAFDRHSNGSLTPEPGSPFIAGGAGTGAGLASQGALQLSSDGRYVLAVDAGSNQVSVLKIRNNGSLKLVGTAWSGGTLPVSIAVHRNLVYVANAGPTNSNFTGFWLGRHGQLKRISGSTVSLPNGSQPGDVLFNGTGRNLIGTLIGTSQIASYTVRRSGRLTAASGSPFAAQGLGPFGSEFRPGRPDQLFVSNAHNTAADSGTVSAFKDSRSGRLSSIGSSPYPDHQMAPCWVEITHNGQFLFAVNTASGSISRYSIAWNGALTLIGSTPVSASGGVGAVDARLSPGGRYLYLDESKIASVGEFAVNGGTLNELSGSPVALPAGTAPAGIVVT
jgi:6-phosphogluconolactonase